MHSEPGMVKAGDEQEAENHPRGMALNQSKRPRLLPVTGAAYIGTLQNRTCFKGETGWLRNIICPSLRGADFFYVIGNYSVMFLLHLKTLCEDAARALFRK